MYVAELRGKLSASHERSEDILTSNVFSFLKYAKRSVYLKRFLSLIGVELTDEELQEVEFVFWPTYEDGTEPDVVLLARDHYLLFEAKYHSGFGSESEDRDAQIPREVEAGRKDAEATGKAVFKAIAITDHPCYPRDSIPAGSRDQVVWINWQSVSRILLDALEHEDTPNLLIAQDLYDLLVKKRLRAFLSFHRLSGTYASRQYEELFFSAASSSFRGQFIGFQEALKEYKPSEARQGALFFSAASSSYRGQFVGFQEPLAEHKPPEPRQDALFFLAASSSFRGQFVGFEAATKECTPSKPHQGKLFFSREYFVDLPQLDVVNSRTLFHRRQT
jgi:hypothetical protein